MGDYPCRMDVLSDVLSSVRLSGSVLFIADFSAPFGVVSPPSPTYAPMLVPGASRLILFHLIIAGAGIVRCGNTAAEVRAGDMLLLPYGDELTVGDTPDGPCQSIFEILPPLPWTATPEVRVGGGGDPMQLVCGFLHADELLMQPLLTDLPKMIVIRGAEANPKLRGLQDFIVEEIRSDGPGAASMVGRLVELLFVEALRHALVSRFDGPVPPLASLDDPMVGKALMLLHGDPARNWTVETLASDAATSRSLLAERFARMVGCPPMEYLTRWRMQLAARRMLDRPDSLTEIATAVGYESDNGFNRTFRRYFGEPPARWRKVRKDKTKAAPAGAA